MKTKPTEAQYQKHKKEMLDDMADTYGYIFCLYCNRSDKPMSPPHHLILRSQQRYHPELHNKLNLYICCMDDHSLLHKHPKLAEPIIEERKLKELFNLQR